MRGAPATTAMSLNISIMKIYLRFQSLPSSTLLMLLLAASVFLMAVVTGCEKPITAPERLATVPEDAIWAGGNKGGDWIDCEYKFKEPHVGYQCDLYNDWTGDLNTTGIFILAKRSGDTFEPIPGAPFQGGAIDEYQFYDGTQIWVSETKKLIPHGWIDYPFGDGSGKRQYCVMGECEEAVEY